VEKGAGGVLAFVSLEGKGWLDLLPEGGIGEGVLKLAAVLAKHEGEVLAVDQTKVGAEKFLESGKGVLKPL
jgi:hypothetical protein